MPKDQDPRSFVFLSPSGKKHQKKKITAIINPIKNDDVDTFSFHDTVAKGIKEINWFDSESKIQSRCRYNYKNSLKILFLAI